MVLRGKRFCEKLRAAAPVVAAVLFFIVLVPLTASAVKKPAAGFAGFVSSVKGKAALIRGNGREVPLEGMDPLRAGDVVGVKAGGAMSVNLCAASKKIDVKGAAVFTVGPKGLKFSKGKAAGAAAIKQSLCKVLLSSSGRYGGAASIKEEVGEAVGAMSAMGLINSGGGGGSLQDVLGGMPDDVSKELSGVGGVGIDGPTAYSYEAYDYVPEEKPDAFADNLDFDSQSSVVMEEKIYKPEAVYVNEPLEEKQTLDRPEFKWSSYYEPLKYVVKIFNSLDIEIFSAETAEPRFRYPADAPALLRGGWYLCEVYSVDAGGEPIIWSLFALSVLDDEAHSRIEREKTELLEVAAAAPSDPGVYILLGRFHESAFMPTSAIEAYEKALALEPDNPALQSRLDGLKNSIQ